MLIKFEFSQQIVEKSTNTKIHENPSEEAELFHADGQTDLVDPICRIVCHLHSAGYSAFVISASANKGKTLVTLQKNDQLTCTR
jgi:hypothetical protein